MPGEGTLVVLDMDGVLLDLGMDAERVRREIREEFASAGYASGFRPLLRSIEEGVEEVARSDVKAARRLEGRAWEIIDGEERRAASAARARDGVDQLLEALEGLPLAVYTNNGIEAARTALAAAGIDTARFERVFGRTGPGSLKPSPDPILEAVELCGPVGRIAMIGDHPYDMMSAAAARERLQEAGSGTTVLSIGMRSGGPRDGELEGAGADFLAADLAEAARFVLTEPAPFSLSIVLLAYNEAGLIERAIAEARRFCEVYAPDHEIIVVDDGSTDGTGDLVDSDPGDDLAVIHHPQNMGMGASMRDGYRVATGDFVAHLPGDRQVRAGSLVWFLPLVERGRVVTSAYRTSPSGRGRALMSRVFRLLVGTVGGLDVDFAGTYVFERSLLDEIEPPPMVASDTFLYSFQLLFNMRRLGLAMERVEITPFPREEGSSREATARRIAGMSREILRHRIASGLCRLIGG